MSEHNFERTKCACAGCKACCKRQPGPLAAGDLERIQNHLGLADDEVGEWFWASPGALVKDQDGRVTRIGSITPQRRQGKCVFLDDQERCTIHEVAPFGCAMFDTHMSNVTAMPRSVWLARSQLDPTYQQQRAKLPYARSYKPTRY
jgi:Fe-S-cluster containining protein